MSTTSLLPLPAPARALESGRNHAARDEAPAPTASERASRPNESGRNDDTVEPSESAAGQPRFQDHLDEQEPAVEATDVPVVQVVVMPQVPAELLVPTATAMEVPATAGVLPAELAVLPLTTVDAAPLATTAGAAVAAGIAVGDAAVASVLSVEPMTAVPTMPLTDPLVDPAVATATPVVATQVGQAAPVVAAQAAATLRPVAATPAPAAATTPGLSPTAAAIAAASAEDADGPRVAAAADLEVVPAATSLDEAEAAASPLAPPRVQATTESMAPRSVEAPRSAAETPADRALAHQVARSLVQQLADGSRSLTIRLTPPELGTVRVQVVEQAGVFNVRLGAEDDAVRAALERALPTLRAELRASPTVIADVQVSDGHLSLLADQRDRSGGRQAGDGRGRRQADDGPGFSLDGVAAPRPAARRSDPGLHARVGATGVDARA